MKKRKLTIKGSNSSWINPYIYCIVNKSNNKVYIGRSYYGHNRRYNHFSSLRKNKHTNIHLQRAWNKYGESNFKFVIFKKLPEDSSHKIINFYEKAFISMYKANSNEFGYNQTKGGDGTSGYIPSIEVRKKMSIKKIGKRAWNKGLKGSIPWNKGKKFPSMISSRRRRVAKLDKDTLQIIKEYNCILHAAQDNNIDSTSIVQVMKGIKKTRGGFKWKYL